MSIIRTLALLGAATLAIANPIARNDNSTISIALSSTPQCTTVGSGPSTLVANECYTVDAGIQSFEFYESPSSYKRVLIYEQELCAEGGKAGSYSAEALGCLEVGFTGYSVKYLYD